jgi:hypothetical protein
MAAAAIAGVESKRTPWPRHPGERYLCCLVCGNSELCSSGLCRRCYDATHHSGTHFGGLKENILERDGGRCRVCDHATQVVHHRQPGLNDPDWLITLCAACHVVAHRLQALDRYLPPLLIELWREQHPEAPVSQLQFEFAERCA